MDTTENKIIELQKQLDDLKRKVYKNEFSNLYVFDEKVKFRSNLIFKKDETSIATSTTDSTGRIAMEDETGAVHYIAYF